MLLTLLTDIKSLKNGFSQISLLEELGESSLHVGPALIAEPVGWVRRSVGLKDLT